LIVALERTACIIWHDWRSHCGARAALQKWWRKCWCASERL